MSEPPISFAHERACREQDARLWSAEDALRFLLVEIEAGRLKPTQLVVHYFEDAGDPDVARFDYGYAVAGVNVPDHIALLEVAKQHLLHEWCTK